MKMQQPKPIKQKPNVSVSTGRGQSVANAKSLNHTGHTSVEQGWEQVNHGCSKQTSAAGHTPVKSNPTTDLLAD